MLGRDASLSGTQRTVVAWAVRATTCGRHAVGAWEVISATTPGDIRSRRGDGAERITTIAGASAAAREAVPGAGDRRLHRASRGKRQGHACRLRDHAERRLGGGGQRLGAHVDRQLEAIATVRAGRLGAAE